MSTKGKTWKWKKDAKRKWQWSAEARKNQWLAKYKGDRYAFNYFKWMHDRCVNSKRQCDFPRTEKGYTEFCKEMGPIPEGMKRPSVGRKNHNKGYVYGNIAWERYEYNVWKNRRTEEEIQETFKDEIPF